MQRMLDSDEPYVLDVIAPYTEHVLPFIPAAHGRGHDLEALIGAAFERRRVLALRFFYWTFGGNCWTNANNQLKTVPVCWSRVSCANRKVAAELKLWIIMQ